MEHFTKYSIADFNDLLSKENHILETDNFQEVGDKIEADGLSFFYISICPQDVEEAIEEEKELSDLLKLNLIEVEGESLSFFIATY